MSDDKLFSFRIGKIAPKPGEILVLKTDEHLSADAQACLRQMVTDVLAQAGHHEQPVMLLLGGMDSLVIDPRDFGPTKAGNLERARQLRRKPQIEHLAAEK